MTTITRERLLKIQQWRETYGPGSNVVLPAEEAEELARIALASLDAGSNSHPAHGPLSNDRLHRIREILGKAAAQSDGGNIGYAMSDAVKAIDELLDVRKAEPVGYYRKGSDGFYFASPTEQRPGTIPLYTAPPEPVVPEAKCDDDGNTTSEFDHGWNSCRAAMLNHSGDVTEMGDAIKQQSSIHTSNGAMSGDAVKQPSNNASSLVFVDEIAEQNGVDPAITDAYMQGYHDSEGWKPAPVDNDDLHEAVSDLLAALDEYPEQLVPINRKSFLVRIIRAAMLNKDKNNG